MWSKAVFRVIPKNAENPQMPVCQGVLAFWLWQVGWMPIRFQKCAVSCTAHGRNKRRLPLKGAVFASRREKLSKQRHYNRQAAEKQEMEAGNLLFCEFRLYGGLDFCYNAENVRKAGTVYANEKKKQSGAADGGV